MFQKTKDRYIKKGLFLCLFVLFIAAVYNRGNVASAAPNAQNDYKQGKVYKITPKTEPLEASKFKRSKAYNSKTKNYFTILSYMRQFEKAGKGTLVLKKGTYSITNVIWVPSNVTIILEKGVKIVKGTKTARKEMPASATIFQLNRPSKSKKKAVYGGHNGEKNIHFVGKGNATIDLKYVQDSIGIVMGHNVNVTVDNINFINMNNGHFMEIDATKNVRVTNCTFKNAKMRNDMAKEAINIDTPDKTTNGFNNAWSKMDKTPNENLTIEDCSFSLLGRAVGTHKYSVKDGEQVYHTGVVIRNNKISDMYWDSPIRILNWKDSIVENNTVDTILHAEVDNSRAMLVSGAVNVSIRNNTIINTDRPIQYMAWENNDAGSQYPVTYNSLTEKNLADLSTNRAINMYSGEYYIRINSEYGVFNVPQTVDVIGE